MVPWHLLVRAQNFVLLRPPPRRQQAGRPHSLRDNLRDSGQSLSRQPKPGTFGNKLRAEAWNRKQAGTLWGGNDEATTTFRFTPIQNRRLT